MSGLGHDLRYALRQMRRNPAFTVAAALTLALGIAATTTVFSFVDAALLRPLPYPEADRLFVLWNERGDKRREPVSYPNFMDYRKRGTLFESLALFRHRRLNVASGESAERLRGAYVAADSRPGVLLGLAGALASARILRSFLYEVEPTDPLTIVLVSSGVAALVVAAALVPARRAAATNVMAVLRSE